jgi:hypothetical protein
VKGTGGATAPGGWAGVAGGAGEGRPWHWSATRSRPGNRALRHGQQHLGRLLGLARPQPEHRGLPRGLKRAALRPDLVDAAGRDQGQGGLCPEI